MFLKLFMRARKVCVFKKNNYFSIRERHSHSSFKYSFLILCQIGFATHIL